VVALWASGFITFAAGQSAAPTAEQAPHINPPIHQSIGRYDAVYRRFTNEFRSAVFFKPKETSGEELSFRLAPLMMQETAAVQGPEPGGQSRETTSRGAELQGWRFGTLERSNGIVKLDVNRPAVYVEMDVLQVEGRPHARLTYVWCYSTESNGHDGASSGDSGPGAERQRNLRFQGIRLTLDSAGRPAIWEVMADDSGAGLMFASQSLETAAGTEFGKPLPGRRYAVERGLNEAPDVVVARVIDDGPVPMGPIVYLSQDTHSVSTLICRCMPAQAKNLTETIAYDLLPLQSVTNSLLLKQTRVWSGARIAFWPGEEQASEGRLTKYMRLPGKF
jgi:hypothetical protein